MHNVSQSLSWHIDIDPTALPIQYLLPHVIPSLERIAPERLAELSVKSNGVSFKISDSPEFQCQALPSLNVVQLSRRVVELAWAFSFAYWEMYRVVLAGKQPNGTEVNLHSFQGTPPHASSALVGIRCTYEEVAFGVAS